MRKRWLDVVLIYCHLRIKPSSTVIKDISEEIMRKWVFLVRSGVDYRGHI